MNASRPIGIFDSGIGGLTVAHAVAQKLPHEDIIYFGDTAHLPYGDKSAATITRYCKTIVDFLLDKQCKLILIACNSAAAAAYTALADHIQQRVPLMSVIDPMVDFVAANYQDQTIGLIGTKQTVQSGIFAQKIAALPNNLQLKMLATPLLVPLIEENFYQNDALVDQVLELYLSQVQLADINALMLACTHYPVLKSRIGAFYQNQIRLLDAGEITANALNNLLSAQQLLNPQTQTARYEFYVSDLTPAFTKMANDFFGQAIKLQLVPDLA